MTTKERFDHLEGRLLAIEGLNVSTQPMHTQSQISKIWLSITNNKGLSIALALVSIVGSTWYARHLANEDENSRLRIDKQINEKMVGVNGKLEQVASTTTRLEATLNTLQPFVSDLVHQEMERAAKAKPAAFITRLPT